MKLFCVKLKLTFSSDSFTSNFTTIPFAFKLLAQKFSVIICYSFISIPFLEKLPHFESWKSLWVRSD